LQGGSWGEIAGKIRIFIICCCGNYILCKIIIGNFVHNDNLPL